MGGAWRLGDEGRQDKQDVRYIFLYQHGRRPKMQDIGVRDNLREANHTEVGHMSTDLG